MGNIIYISTLDTRKRIDKMSVDTYEKAISDLRKSKEYHDMPAIAESLLALLAENTYPIPIISIAKKLGFKVYDTDMDKEGLSGFIAIDHKLEQDFGTSKIIVVNTQDSSGHKRFTIAHELAHYLFDSVQEEEYYNTYCPDESPWREEEKDLDNRERVANYFAANLLMPSLDFRRKYIELKNTNENSSLNAITLQLADYFGVPETAVRIRYKELGIMQETV